MRAEQIDKKTYISLLVRHEHRVRKFMFTMLPRVWDVDDLFQEVSITGWEKFGDFQYSEDAPDEEFVRWLCTIAKYKILNHRRKLANRRVSVEFDDILLDRLAELQFSAARHLEDRRQTLDECVRSLSPRKREILGMRYGRGMSVESIAKSLQRSKRATYTAVQKIRDKLMECVEASAHRREPL